MDSDSSGPVPSPLMSATATATPPASAKMARTCSLCGTNGHNSRTCNTDCGGGGGGGGGAFMLFGVNLTEAIDRTSGSSSSAAAAANASSSSNSFRKSASMTNLSHFDRQPHDLSADVAAVASGYASDDTIHASGRSRERKRGVPWTEDEHKLFLLGLQKVGKGDWRGISRNFVKTRTPTQVASHAQKYFLRRTNLNRRRRRSSLFDITTDTVMNLSSTEEQQQFQQETISQSKPPISHTTSNSYPLTLLPPIARENNNNNNIASTNLPSSFVFPVSIPPPPPSQKLADLNLNESPEPIAAEVDPVSQLRSSPPSERRPPTSPPFQQVGFGGKGDNIISVA